ncbi:kinase-like protein, partial [Auricularia subglabra TFB-10046 SS5]
RELRAWRAVQHPYILPLLGFNDSNGNDPLLLITPWMTNGNLTEHLRRYPGADRPRLVHQIAEGLSYLHMVAKIVHGDLKGENILVSQTGDPLVADFGLSTLIEKTDEEGTTESAIRQFSTFVFSAPELLADDV